MEKIEKIKTRAVIEYFHKKGFNASEIHVDLEKTLSKGKTIIGEYYSSLLEQLLEEIRQKRTQKLHHGALFHQDNAPAYKAHVTVATTDNCGFQIVQHPLYS